VYPLVCFCFEKKLLLAQRRKGRKEIRMLTFIESQILDEGKESDNFLFSFAPLRALRETAF